MNCFWIRKKSLYVYFVSAGYTKKKLWIFLLSQEESFCLLNKQKSCCFVQFHAWKGCFFIQEKLVSFYQKRSYRIFSSKKSWFVFFICKRSKQFEVNKENVVLLNYMKIMAQEGIFSQLSLWTVNLCLQSYIFCL